MNGIFCGQIDSVAFQVIDGDEIHRRVVQLSLGLVVKGESEGMIFQNGAFAEHGTEGIVVGKQRLVGGE